MKQIFTLSLILLFLNIFGQNEEAKTLIDEGLKLHNQGEYKKAIKKYEKAYKLDENSLVALYEMSFSYLSLKNYAKTEELCQVEYPVKTCYNIFLKVICFYFSNSRYE